MEALSKEAAPAARMQAGAAQETLKNLAFEVGKWLLLALVFGLSYTQSPLYDGNQNTKFLHGVAQAGWGFLQEDWLANTADPLPVFSALVSFTLSHLHPYAFYGYYLLLMGVYIYSLLGIGAALFRRGSQVKTRYLVLFAILLAVHSMRVQVFATQRFNLDLLPFHFGLAGQYLLGQEFQNSSFGVFLLFSIFLYLKRRYSWAIFWLGLASIFHSAYLFSAALLTVAYAAGVWWENLQGQDLSRRALLGAAAKPIAMGMLALVLVLPVLWHNQTYLAGTSPEASQQALDILVHYRIPHHSLPASWLNQEAYLQIGIMLAGLVLAWRSRLFPVMAVLFGGGALLTLVQVLTGSDTLALLSPWRVSVLLVPLSITLIAAFSVSLVYRFFDRPLQKMQPIVLGLVLVASLLLAYGGVKLQEGRFERYANRAVVRMMNFVKENRAPGQVYLVPPKDNKFDDFRLYTGAPIFINWKSHPYRDFEVLEWYHRVETAEAFFNAPPAEACRMLDDLAAQYNLTHVIFKFDRPGPDCARLQEVYRDKRYTIFAIQPVAAANP